MTRKNALVVPLLLLALALLMPISTACTGGNAKTKAEKSTAEPQTEIVTDGGPGSVANKPMAEGDVRRFRMTGTLNDEVKAKCQGFRNLRGELWAVTGDLKTFKTGDKVVLEGLQSPATECGVPTLKVTSIEPFQE
jgi:hypothetical protein